MKEFVGVESLIGVFANQSPIKAREGFKNNHAI
jgi:hypothetical protein